MKKRKKRGIKMEKIIAQIEGKNGTDDTIIKVGKDEDILKIDLGKQTLMIPRKSLERAGIELK